MPRSLQYLSELFDDFYTGGDFTYTELVNYQKVMGITLEPYECEILRQIWLEKRVSDYERDAKLLEAQKANTGKNRRRR